MNKKFILFLFLLVFPLSSYGATFDHDLYFGMRNDDGVRELQRFLISQSLFNEEVTGNFFTITRDAVRHFQEQEGITPAVGYFGPKTRTVANQKLGGASPQSGDRLILIEFLKKRMSALQQELDFALERQKRESEVLPTPPPPPAPSPVASPTPPSSIIGTTTAPLAVVTGVKFGGESTTTFPTSASPVEPLKIGDIVIRNDTDSSLLFSQLVFDIYDAMNSTLNRGREITLFLREGTTTSDTLISKTKFTFNVNPLPTLEGMHRYQVKTEYPILFAAGETKSVGFWIENFEYVISGTLKFTLYDIQTSRTVDRIGAFSFLLTR